LLCQQKSHDVFGRGEWEIKQPSDFSPIILEFPFQIKLGILKDLLASSFHSRSRNEFEMIKNLFESGLKDGEDKLKELESEQSLQNEHWQPTGVFSTSDVVQLNSFFTDKFGIGASEAKYWEGKDVTLPKIPSFLDLGGYVRVADMENHYKKPLSLNALDMVISLLNCATVSGSSYMANGTSCKNKVVTTFPSSFTNVLLQCTHELGRPGMARFTQTLSERTDLSVYFDVKSTKILLFPFQGICSDDMYLGVFVTHNVVSKDGGKFHPQFCLIRFSPDVHAVLEAELTYVSVLNDFVSMLFLQQKIPDCTIGQLLHATSSYVPHCRAWTQRCPKIVTHGFVDRKIALKNQTNALLCTVLDFYSSEHSTDILERFFKNFQLLIWLRRLL